MGFWSKTLWAFTQTPEEKAKLEEFVKNKKQELDREKEIEIAQYREQCAQRVADLQKLGQEQIEATRQKCLARIDKNPQLQKLLEMGIVDEEFVKDFKNKLQKY